jgi:hypothetical protein
VTPTVAQDDPHAERHTEELRERSRVVRSLLMGELEGRGITADHNLVLLTAGLREELARLHTTQLFWEVISGEGPNAERQLVVLD